MKAWCGERRSRREAAAWPEAVRGTRASNSAPPDAVKMAMVSAAMNSNQKRKKKPTAIDAGGEGMMSLDEEFDNPLASSNAAEESRKDFQAAGGELAEYGEGYDEQFSSSQIFQKLEQEASVSLLLSSSPPLVSSSSSAAAAAAAAAV
eukprot:COSAG02_NODE_295_length_25421_cov_88.063226_2_plen_148_part_00